MPKLVKETPGMSSRVRKSIRRVNHARIQEQKRSNAMFDDSIQLFIQLKLKLITAEELGEVEPARINILNELYQDEYGRECPWFKNCRPLENWRRFEEHIDLTDVRPQSIPMVRDDTYEELLESPDCAIALSHSSEVIEDASPPTEEVICHGQEKGDAHSIDSGILDVPTVFNSMEEQNFVPTIEFGIPIPEFMHLTGLCEESGSDIFTPDPPVKIPIALKPILGIHLMRAGNYNVVCPLANGKLVSYYEFTPNGKLRIEDLLLDCELTQLMKALVSTKQCRYASHLRHQTRTKLARTLVDVLGKKPTWTPEELGCLVTCMANAAERRGRIIAGTTTLRVAAAWLFHVIKEFKLNRLGRYMPDGSKYDAYRISPQERSRSGRLKKPRSFN